MNLLVVAKKEWFKGKEKGIGYKTWQGNVFLLVIILIQLSSVFLSMYMEILGWILSSLFIFLLFDGIYASVQALDERDQQHYSLSMRNMAWGMIITMIVLFMLSKYLVFLQNVMWVLYITAAVGFVVAQLTKHKLDRVS